MAPHGKELSEDLRIIIVALHIDGRGYKISNNLKLSYSTVARVIQRFSNTGFTRNRPRKGRSEKLSPRAVCQVQKLASKNRCMSVASIALEVAEVEGQLVSSQTTRHILQQVGLHGRHPRRKPLLKLAHKKARKQLAEDNLSKSMNYWNHVQWSDETQINLFGSDGVQHVWQRTGEEYQENCVLPTVKHGGGSIMAWGCTSAAGTGELRFIEGNMDYNMYCAILKQNIRNSLQKLGRMAVFQHNNDPKHTTKIQTALLMKLKVMEWLSMSAVMSSMPRRIKAVLDNNYIIDTLDTVLTCSLRVYSFLLPVIWKIMAVCGVIFRGQ